jgi:hypothetical protein
MPGVGFAERYVMARESNVVRVDFARRPDPPTPRFPGAGALRPATRRIAAMDQDEPQARSAPSPLAGEGGQRGWLECSVVLAAPLPVPPPQAGTGTMGAPALVLLREWLGSTSIRFWRARHPFETSETWPRKEEETMWTAVFSIAFVIAIAMSVAALLVQSDRIRYP